MPNQTCRCVGRRMMVPLLGAVALALLATGGCAPQHIGRYNELAFGDTKRVRNEIWKSYDQWYSELRYWVQDEFPEEDVDFPGPTAGDLRPPEGDYILGAGDVIRVTIHELLREGRPFIQDVRISEEGNVSLPYLPDVKAAGYTTRGLENHVIEMLQPPEGPLKNPRVQIFVSYYRNRTFAMVSGVQAPGVYELRSNEMDLLQAFSMAGGVLPYTEQYGYILRTITKEELADLLVEAWAQAEEEPGEEEAEEAPETGEGEGEPSEAEAPGEPALTPMEELRKVAEGERPEIAPPSEAETVEGEEAAPAADEEAVTPQAPSPEGEEGGWQFKEGRWVRVEPAGEEEGEEPAGEATEEAAAEGPPEDLAEDLAELPPSVRKRLRRLGVVQSGEGLKRIIRIDVPALTEGLDPSQNVVLRHGDVINVPQPPAGEWYIDGEVARRGAYSLTGRKITLLQAIAAAGGLTQVAIPKRTELVRRVSDDAEEIIYVDLGEIARGEAPDFFLQPEDLIRVGTDQGAIFLAVLRNAFRATYGFGLVYDQNFADIYPWEGGINPLFGD